MNIYLWIVVGALLLEFFLQTLSKVLDLKNISTSLPPEFNEYYSEDEYARSQKYLRSNTRFSYFTSTLDLILILLIIYLGLFNTIDLWVRGFGYSPLITGLLFLGILFFIQDIFYTPLSIYRTFVIEEKFGFNKTTPKTYVLDKIKAYFLLIILGGIIFSCLLYFFEIYGNWAWLYAWVIVSGFLILIQPIFTLIIAPMFNKFTQLENGELKHSIEEYSRKVDFPINKIDVMDGSRRSSKGNAYFSGIGKNKRIALFDTLIEKHDVDEILSIIAHEVGHYKHHHNIKGILIGVIQTGLMFFLLSIFLNNPQLFSAFKMENISIYCSLIFFTLLYSPIDIVLSIISNKISRLHEFEADSFAKRSIGTGKHLIKGLKKLTVSNLGNLTPHPFTVWLGYSHPTVIDRISALKDEN